MKAYASGDVSQKKKNKSQALSSQNAFRGKEMVLNLEERLFHRDENSCGTCSSHPKHFFHNSFNKILPRNETGKYREKESNTLDTSVRICLFVEVLASHSMRAIRCVTKRRMYGYPKYENLFNLYVQMSVRFKPNTRIYVQISVHLMTNPRIYSVYMNLID